MIFDLKIDISSKTIDDTRGRPITLLISRTSTRGRPITLLTSRTSTRGRPITLLTSRTSTRGRPITLLTSRTSTRGRPITLLTSHSSTLCILFCFRQWEISLKITFIPKNPMEIRANLEGIELNTQLTSSFDFVHILFD